jgi:predicted DNA-binding transcriptional regulator YafY
MMKLVAFKTSGRPAPHRKPARLRRCLEIFVRLRTGPAYVWTLARVFGVDRRSIQRDLRVLADAGVKLEMDADQRWRLAGGTDATDHQ